MPADNSLSKEVRMMEAFMDMIIIAQHHNISFNEHRMNEAAFDQFKADVIATGEASFAMEHIQFDDVTDAVIAAINITPKLGEVSPVFGYAKESETEFHIADKIMRTDENYTQVDHRGWVKDNVIYHGIPHTFEDTGVLNNVFDTVRVETQNGHRTIIADDNHLSTHIDDMAVNFYDLARGNGHDGQDQGQGI